MKATTDDDGARRADPPRSASAYGSGSTRRIRYYR